MNVAIRHDGLGSPKAVAAQTKAQSRLLYFVLFNLGLIALAVPVPHRVVTLDWPFLIGATWLATAFLWRGRLTRIQGAALLTVYSAYIVASILI